MSTQVCPPSFATDELEILATNLSNYIFQLLDSLEEEEKVLEWLLEFRDTVEQAEESDESIIEDVNSKVLQALIQNTDSLAVLFYDGNSKKSTQVLVELENIGRF